MGINFVADLSTESEKLVEGDFEVVRTAPKLLTVPKLELDNSVQDWKEYRIKYTGGPFKDMLLADVKLEDLTMIAESTARKAEKNPACKEEHQIMMACIKDRTEPENQSA